MGSAPPSSGAHDALLQQRRRLELVSAVVHDLNQPLMVVLGQLELIREGIVGPDALPRNLEAMEAAAQRMSHLSRGLREELSRAEPRGSSDLAEIVRATAPDLDLHLTEGLQVPVRADRIALVVHELVTNARRYGAPPVWLDTVADGARARVEVVDHGPGIPEAGRAELLKPFASDRGGVGLPIVARIARGAGGQIELAETPGGGLTVRVWLPLEP